MCEVLAVVIWGGHSDSKEALARTIACQPSVEAAYGVMRRGKNAVREEEKREE